MPVSSVAMPSASFRIIVLKKHESEGRWSVHASRPSGGECPPPHVLIPRRSAATAQQRRSDESRRPSQVGERPSRLLDLPRAAAAHALVSPYSPIRPRRLPFGAKCGTGSLRTCALLVQPLLVSVALFDQSEDE